MNMVIATYSCMNSELHIVTSPCLLLTIFKTQKKISTKGADASVVACLLACN